MRFKRAPRRDRGNPDLLILTNPGGAPSVAPPAWARFHYAEADDAEWEQIADIKGLPRVAWALGFFEGGEWVDDRGQVIEAHGSFTKEGGPWLISARNDPKSLWVVARDTKAVKR